MSIMIYGLEMPKDGEWYEINIFPNGEVCRTNWQGDQMLIKGVTAVQIPQHGRLIDADALLERFEKEEEAADEHGRDFSFSFKIGGENCTEWWPVQQMLMDAETVIQAEEGEK